MADADPRDARIVELERENAEHRTIIAVQAARIAELEEAIRKLTAKLGQNSLNSSLPPSRDNSDARKKRPSRGKRKRKRGGQKGHKGANRELRPAEEADEIVDHVPDRCGDCGRRLRGLDADPQRRQIVELPPIKAHLTEHRFHSLPCECGAVTRADTPPELRHGDFGPHLCALVSLLGGGFRMSKRNIRSLLSDVLGIDVSLGAVSNIEARASEELAVLHDEALRRVRSSPFVNMDETPWSEGRGSAWLWVATTCDVAYYRIAPERSAAIVEQILGKDFGGIVGNDRAKAYLVIDPQKRQICWFHLGRNFQSKIEIGGVDARFGRQMRAFERRLWRAQHLFEAGSIDRSSYDRRMKMLRGEVHRAIVGWAASGDPKLGVAAMAANLLQLEPALWAFVDNPHVEPTNNLAERDIRHPVIWRRSSFGTDSSRGSRFVERILTIVATCRKQGRSAFRFLADFLTAAWAGHACPPLIHNTS